MKCTLCGALYILSSLQPGGALNVVLTSHLCSGVLGDQVLAAKFSLSTNYDLFFFQS